MDRMTNNSTNVDRAQVMRGSSQKNDVVKAAEAKKAEAKPHTMPLVVTVDGKPIYTRENF